jgi:hypothetical protein
MLKKITLLGSNKMRLKALNINLIIIVIIFVSSVTIFAQNTGNDKPKDKEPPVEELYLKNPELQIISEEAASNDREAKLRACDGVQKALKEGVSGDEEYTMTMLLGRLAGEGTTTLHSEKGKIINYFPEVRSQACNALQFVKTEKAKEKAVSILIGVLLNDIDPIVKSNAAYALGVIGLNEEGYAVNAIAQAIEVQDAVAPNDNFAYVAALSLGKIAKANNGIYEPKAYRALVRIAQGNYSNVVKEKALEILDELRKYK